MAARTRGEGILQMLVLSWRRCLTNAVTTWNLDLEMAFGTRRILRRFITVTVWSVAVICVAWFLLSKTVPAASETVDDGRFEETHATSRTSLDQLLMSPDMFNEALAPNKKNHSVALVSMYLKSAEAMRSLTFENKQKYAEAQGYTFIDISSNKTLMAIVDTPEMQRNIYLLKTFVIAQVLEQGIFDWVMWCDADAIFLNHGKSLEQAGAIDDDFDLVLAGGHSMDWHWGKIVNSGHFTVKNSAWSKWFLQKLWNERPRTGAKCPGTIYNNLNNWLGFCWGEGEDIGYWLGEQGAIHALIRSSFYPTDFACHVKWVNMRDMNSEFPVSLD